MTKPPGVSLVPVKSPPPFGPTSPPVNTRQSSREVAVELVLDNPAQPMERRGVLFATPEKLGS
jgi:hypothetical protein